MSVKLIVLKFSSISNPQIYYYYCYCYYYYYHYYYYKSVGHNTIKHHALFYKSTFSFVCYLIHSRFVSLANRQPQRSAPTVSSAVPVASASRRRSRATTRPTAMTAATRRPARPSPAAPSPSAAKTPCACPACGPAMATPTVPTAQTSRPRRAAPTPCLRPPGTAPPRSSTAAAASASTRAGGATAEMTAWTAQTRATAVSHALLIAHLRSHLSKDSLVSKEPEPRVS